MAVLLEQGLIEIERVAELRDFAGSGAFAEHLLDRVAGDDVNHQKNQGEDQPKRGKREKKTLREVARDFEELLQEQTPVDSGSFFSDVAGFSDFPGFSEFSGLDFSDFSDCSERALVSELPF